MRLCSSTCRALRIDNMVDLLLLQDNNGMHVFIAAHEAIVVSVGINAANRRMLIK